MTEDGRHRGHTALRTVFIACPNTIASIFLEAALRCISLFTISTHLTQHYLRSWQKSSHRSRSRLNDPVLRECCFVRRDASETLGCSVRGCGLSYLGMRSVVPEANHRLVEIVFVAERA